MTEVLLVHCAIAGKTTAATAAFIGEATISHSNHHHCYCYCYYYYHFYLLPQLTTTDHKNHNTS